MRALRGADALGRHGAQPAHRLRQGSRDRQGGGGVRPLAARGRARGGRRRRHARRGARLPRDGEAARVGLGAPWQSRSRDRAYWRHVLAGCAGDSDEARRHTARTALPSIVLKHDDLTGTFHRFDEGRQSRADDLPAQREQRRSAVRPAGRPEGARTADRAADGAGPARGRVARRRLRGPTRARRTDLERSPTEVRAGRRTTGGRVARGARARTTRLRVTTFAQDGVRPSSASPGAHAQRDRLGRSSTASTRSSSRRAARSPTAAAAPVRGGRQG